MECNKDDALKARELAEKKFVEWDLKGAKKFALKAQNLFPSLEGIAQFLATLDVYLAAEGTVYGEKDWYAVLDVGASADEDTVKKQYRKLALLLHPDKNKSVGGEGAFKLISEAWHVLSDKSRRILYDQKRNPKGFLPKTSQSVKSKTAQSKANGFSSFPRSASSQARAGKSSTDVPRATMHSSSKPPIRETFWTSCNGCKMQYEYLRVYLNHNLLCPSCHEPFVAKETQCPTPEFVSQQNNANSDHNLTSKIPHNQGRCRSTMEGMEASGFQNGANQGSYSHQKFQWGPFSRTAGAASATASSTAAAQAANVVHHTYEKVRREREEAQAAARREETIRRKHSSLKRNASASGVLNAGSNDAFPAKRARVGGDVPANDNGMASVDQFVMSEVNRASGNFGDSKLRTGGRLNNFSREFTRLGCKNMLIEMAKLAIDKKLEEWKSMSTAKLDANENTKKKHKQSETDKEEAKDVDHGDASDEDLSAESVSNTKTIAVEKKSSHIQSVDSDSENNDPVSINVPDPDFHDFDNDRSEQSFGNDQIWATYDDEDGMPRYYALVQQIISLNPFKVRMSFLTSKSNSEFGPLNWVASGFPKSCGDFRVGRYEVSDTINIFSHKVSWEKGPRGVIKIIPRKGETWALYRNWSPEWNEHTPDDVIYKYDMVEVLEDYNEEQGVSVIPLVKASGFRTVFCHHMDLKEVKRIRKEEMFRFSHQVPCYLLTGEEAENAPKGLLELDPAATPLELLQIINENKREVVAEAVEQTVK